MDPEEEGGFGDGSSLLAYGTPATEPVTTAELKSQMRVSADFTADDTYIAALGVAAREYFENYTSTTVLTTTHTLTLGDLPGSIVLPRPPVASITSVVYTDSNGTSQTLAASQYTLIASPVRAILVPAYGVTWPTPRDVPNAVVVTYVAGAASVGAVLGSAKIAIKMMAAHWYESREAVMGGPAMAAVPHACEALMIMASTGELH